MNTQALWQVAKLIVIVLGAWMWYGKTCGSLAFPLASGLKVEKAFLICGPVIIGLRPIRRNRVCYQLAIV